MSSITVKPTEENTAARLVYHSWRIRFPEEIQKDDLMDYEEPATLFQKEDKPVHIFKVDLPFPGQTCVTVFEEFADGSWAIFFEDCPNIIGGSNDSWEDALSDLAVIVRDILQDIEKYEDSVSLYQEERRQFIKKVFGL